MESLGHAWHPEGSHRALLDIRAASKLVRQQLRHFGEEKRRAIGEEIHKLLVARFIKEVFHPK
jgi:hypothetical protein